MSDENVGMSGLTASEASEFMRSYEKGMWTFVAIASVAPLGRMDVAALVRNVIRGYHFNQATVRLDGLVVIANGEMK